MKQLLEESKTWWILEKSDKKFNYYVLEKYLNIKKF